MKKRKPSQSKINRFVVKRLNAVAEEVEKEPTVKTISEMKQTKISHTQLKIHLKIYIPMMIMRRHPILTSKEPRKQLIKKAGLVSVEVVEAKEVDKADKAIGEEKVIEDVEEVVRLEVVVVLIIIKTRLPKKWVLLHSKQRHLE